ncbi:hypothetical protein HHL16_11615 [Pseudoflavitalea sp. G-6-1-2]|uniref:hypothetical protein n=1 Tax=Pseudoflavitalea sp. G-6-1-2 TaxID=2728841 RepID=UPI00146E6F23|nr:hypothetical protein [Pseudoflavitalea sp. G-6-1-2]NML21526.1 hypothetical protein [Pseudoflavitalea sp. G-6-1-2]
MAKKLDHRQIHGVLAALGDSKIVNLDASIKSLITPVGEAIGRTNPQDEVSLHVLCCNEYALVTGLTGANLAEVEKFTDAIRSSIGK